MIKLKLNPLCIGSIKKLNFCRYGVTLLKDRSRKPEILPLEELLSRVVSVVSQSYFKLLFLFNGLSYWYGMID